MAEISSAVWIGKKKRLNQPILAQRENTFRLKERVLCRVR